MRVTRRQIRKKIKLLIEASYANQKSKPDQIQAPNTNNFGNKITFVQEIGNPIYNIVGSAGRGDTTQAGYLLKSDIHTKHYIVTGDIDRQLSNVAQDTSVGMTGEVGEYLTGEVCSLPGVTLAGGVQHVGYSNLNLETESAGQQQLANVAGKPAGGFKGADVWLARETAIRFDTVVPTGSPSELTLDFAAAGTFVSAKASRITDRQGLLSKQPPSLSASDQEDVAGLIMFFWLQNNLVNDNNRFKLISITGKKSFNLADIASSVQSGKDELENAYGIYAKSVLNKEQITSKPDQYMDYTGTKKSVTSMFRDLGIKTIKMRFDAVNICGIATGYHSDLINPNTINPIADSVSYSAVVYSKENASEITITIPEAGETFTATGATNLATETYLKRLAALHTTDFKHDSKNLDAGLYIAPKYTSTTAYDNKMKVSAFNPEGLPGVDIESTSQSAAESEVVKYYGDTSDIPVTQLPAGMDSSKTRAQFKNVAKKALSVQMLQNISQQLSQGVAKAKVIVSPERKQALKELIGTQINSLDEYVTLIDTELSSTTIPAPLINTNAIPNNAFVVSAKERNALIEIKTKRVSILKDLKNSATELKAKATAFKTSLDSITEGLIIGFLENSLDSFDRVEAEIPFQKKLPPDIAQAKPYASSAIYDRILGLQNPDELGTQTFLQYLIDTKKRIKKLDKRLNLYTSQNKRENTPHLQSRSDKSVLEMLAYMFPNKAIPSGQELLNLQATANSTQNSNAANLITLLGTIIPQIKNQYNILVLASAFKDPPLLTFNDWNTNISTMGIFVERKMRIQDTDLNLLINILITDLNTSLDYAEKLTSSYNKSLQTRNDLKSKKSAEYKDSIINISDYQKDPIPFGQEDRTAAALNTNSNEPILKKVAAESKIYEAILRELMKY